MRAKPSDIRDWVIYKITNPNGRVYIGKSSDFTARKRQYKCIQLKAQNLITRSLIKYGFDNHTFETIDSFRNTGSYSEDKEMFWIRTYMSNRCKFPHVNGMNMTDGGEGALGVKRSDKFREEAASRGRGRATSDYQKKVASEIHKGNKWNVGRVQGQEERDKRAAKIRGRKMGYEELESRKEMNVILRGKCVIVYDSVTGVESEYRTISDAASSVGMTNKTFTSIIRGDVKTKPYHKNRRYTFKYKAA